MPTKNIIFCADGVWNVDAGDPADITAPTNVLKLFQNLPGRDAVDAVRQADEQERVSKDAAGDAVQVALYLRRGGDLRNWLVGALGDSLAKQLVASVVRGYTYISRHYVPGDRIYLVGFSRGAYAARALAGMIGSQGLLDASRMTLGDRPGAYRAGASVWKTYRKSALAPKGKDALAQLEEFVDLLPGFFNDTPDTLALIGGVPIEAVAVWDTVGSLGIPMVGGHGADIDALRFADSRLDACVKHALHAVAMDERRASFAPCLWDADPRVTQRLFAGAHSDVGGGYPIADGDSGLLSDCALQWMMERLESLGMVFSSPRTVVPMPEPTATAHAPWMHPPWSAFPTAARTWLAESLPEGLQMDASVLLRRAATAIPSAAVPALPLQRPSRTVDARDDPAPGGRRPAMPGFAPAAPTHREHPSRQGSGDLLEGPGDRPGREELRPAAPLIFGISAPTTCRPDSEFGVAFAAYVAAAKKSALAAIRSLIGRTGREALDIPSGGSWRVGTPFTVRLLGRSFAVEPDQQTFKWGGRHDVVSFTVRVLPEAAGTAMLTALVLVGDLPIATIPIQLRIRPPSSRRMAEPQNVHRSAPRSAFASYSSKDQAIVAGRLSTLCRACPAMDIFQDCLDLRPNEAYKPQLERQIVDRDAFFLFWSRNAADSPWVRWELDTARRHDIESIIPMPLEDPAIAPPPPELDDLHFKDRFMLARYAARAIADEMLRNPRDGGTRP